jgi:hypothetical protein
MPNLIRVIESLELAYGFNLLLSRLVSEGSANKGFFQVIYIGMGLLLYFLNGSFEVALLLERALQGNHLG